MTWAPSGTCRRRGGGSAHVARFGLFWEGTVAKHTVAGAARASSTPGSIKKQHGSAHGPCMAPQSSMRCAARSAHGLASLHRACAGNATAKLAMHELRGSHLAATWQPPSSHLATT
eukprot:196646-Chlamydomonas_euryale.AAC.1